MTTFALVGNPNSGKTTLFNALTGTHQRVGNWPGVTVERKSGDFSLGSARAQLIDLPGTYSLTQSGAGLDEQIARDFLSSGEADVAINVVDAASLSRGLYLTNDLQALGIPTVVVVNMLDVAAAQGLEVNTEALAARLGCPVVPLIATRRDSTRALLEAIPLARPVTGFVEGAEEQRYAYIDTLVRAATVIQAQPDETWSERIDRVVLHPVFAFPIFLGVMYLLFLFSINVGSAFIDLFDGLGSVAFVEAPRNLLQTLAAPQWLIIFIADGVGGGVQLVGTFIPVIGTLFLALAALEDSGYMARVAFIVDRLLRSLGLPGKAFVPLIVGFGCNVPAVMATRALDSQPDRILTTLMAPYMSCGARLTVYALFAAAFFPRNGQNVVFALYLIGIAIAVLSALAVRRHLLPDYRGQFILELPAYHVPTLRNLLMQTWQRLKGFVLRAGKAIVVVVIALNVLNSIGTDGSVGNENSERSVLSAIGKQLTPVFAPMGIREDNWPATVGIFTGIFAKEVVVGTLDALYAPAAAQPSTGLLETLRNAFASVPENLGMLGEQLGDPLGLELGDLSDTAAQADAQAVALDTIGAMQSLFDGQLGAFAYLLFILLYMPCVATIGVIYKEIGAFWALFSVAWSFVVAYTAATVVYQLGQLSHNPTSALGWSALTLGLAALSFAALLRWGQQRHSAERIPLKIID